MIRALLDNKAALEFFEPVVNWNPLHLAAMCNQRAALEVLIRSKANVNVICRDKRTPLYLAARQGHNEGIETLLAANVTLHSANDDKMTPLPVHGCVTSVQLLLDAKTAPDVKDCYENTPLHNAAHARRSAVMNVLID